MNAIKTLPHPIPLVMLAASRLADFKVHPTIDPLAEKEREKVQLCTP